MNKRNIYKLALTSIFNMHPGNLKRLPDDSFFYFSKIGGNLWKKH